MAMQVPANSAATVIMCHVIEWEAWKACWEGGRGVEGVQLHAAAALYYEDGRPLSHEGARLRHDSGAGVVADVDHLGASVRLLCIVGERHTVELAHGVVALQHA